MAIDACPCMPLRRGTMILAVIDAVLSMLNLCLFVLALVVAIRNDQLELTKNERNVAIAVCIILIILCVLQILLAFRLYHGARNSDYRNCRIWFIVTGVILVINIINLILNSTASEINGASFGGALIGILYKAYEMLVVYQLLKQISAGLGAGVVYPSHAYPQPEPYSPSGQIYVTPQPQTHNYPMQQFGHTSTGQQVYPGAAVVHITNT